MRFLLLACVLCSGAVAQMTAVITDPKSHGTLGDNLLSLNEAIRVMNTQLPLSSLSAAEQAQFRGSPQYLERIEVDTMITPVITIEQQLDQIVGDNVSHVDTDFVGLNGRPLIDATAVDPDEVFPARTNHFKLINFVVKGGKSAVIFDASLHYHPGRIMRVENCSFSGQSLRGVQVRVPSFPPGSLSPAIILDSVFSNLPIGVEILELGLSVKIDVDIDNVRFDGCQTGIAAQMTGNGSNVTADLRDVTIVGATTGVGVSRNLGSDSTLAITMLYTDISSSGHGIDVAGDVIGGTILDVHHSDIRGGGSASDYALRTQPSSGRFDVTIGEVQCNGNVQLAVGKFSSKLRVHNSHFENGNFDLETTGAVADLQWDAFESAPVTVGANTTKAVNIVQSEFVRSPVMDMTSGMTSLLMCYLGASSVGGNVVNQSPAPSRWIGRTSVLPPDPPIGGVVDFALDLEPGTAAVWIIGLADPNPNTTFTPLRFYFDLTAMVVLPGQYRLQDRLRFTIPNNPTLIGAAFDGQAAMFATQGQSYVPPVTLPRGGRFVIR